MDYYDKKNKHSELGKRPAFPSLEFHDEFDDALGKYVPVPHMEGGLTKREYFSAMAMQGMISTRIGVEDWTSTDLAKEAVIQADQLIKALQDEGSSTND